MSQASVMPMRPSRPKSVQRSLLWLTRRGPLYLLILFLSALFAAPFVWMMLSSLKTAPEWYAMPPTWLPAVPQWGNFARVWTLYQFPVLRWTYNSLLVVFLATTGTLLSASVVAYGFARLRFRGRDTLFIITLATMMLPAQVTLIPQFIMFLKLKWLNTFMPLWVPFWFGGGAFAIFVMRQFYMTLPKELDEAARIDGAGYLRIFTSILIPLCKPALATIGIVSFMDHWGDFMGPLIYLTDKKNFTVALGLRFFSQSGASAGTTNASMEPLETILMAATTLSIIPCVVIFFAGQRYFVKGIATTGLKG
jgi:multiple sugar transport system permease protein